MPSSPPSPTGATHLTLGIVAHVDAGKTSLTERLLHDAGVVAALGRVDEGTTRTDSMDLERRRGITIRAAVATFPIEDLEVTVVDTPGHSDFIAEVERSLTVLDAAVLVLSAVEGVQPQSVVLWRALQRIGIPTVVFVNKVDRAEADVDRVVEQVRRRLGAVIVPFAAVRGAAHGTVTVEEIPLLDERVVEAVAHVDGGVMARWVDNVPLHETQLAAALRRCVGRGELTPMVCGSAITGAGTSLLRQVLSRLVPRAADPGAELAATVFAIDRVDAVRRNWIRLWSGEIAVRDRVSVAGRPPQSVTGLVASGPAGAMEAGVVRAGQIAALRGPACRIGDVIGRPPTRRALRFPSATMQAVVTPVDPTQRTALFTALAELADEDPLIDLRIDAAAAEAAVSLHGEVQKEVIAALLEERFGVAARFAETSAVCIERVAGVGAAVEHMWAGGNPYLATVGLRVEPAQIGSGVEFSSGLEPGRLLPAFIAATEEGVRAALRQGLLGWEVTDCRVTMTASRYLPRQSHRHQRFNKAMSSVGADFRNLAPVVTLAALASAGTVVCEPVERYDLEFPVELNGPILRLLGRHGALVEAADSAGGYARITGRLAAREVPDLARLLPDLTGGEAVLETRHDHYAPVVDRRTPPARRRSRPDAADRDAWFRDMPR